MGFDFLLYILMILKKTYSLLHKCKSSKLSPAQWFIWKILPLKAQEFHTAKVCVLVAPFPTQLNVCGLKKQQRNTYSLVSLPLHRRRGRSFWLLVLDRPSSGHCGHLGSESMDGRSFLFPFYL